jgi:Glycosyltransferase
MKIAQIAPPWITIPPKNYGGTENVIYNLVEAQVAQGHDVTLFAPGDARTSAHLVSFFPRSLIDAGVPWHAHLKAFYHFYKAIEYIQSHHFDIVHMHLSSSADMYLFPLATQLLKTPCVMTVHSHFPFDRVQSWVGDADTYYMEWVKLMPLIAISRRARLQFPPHLRVMDVIHHGLPMGDFAPTVERPGNYLAWLGRFVPEKGAARAIQVARATKTPLIMAGTVDRYVKESVEYFEREIKPQIDGELIKYIGPVDLHAKVDLLSGAKGFLNPIDWEEPFGMVMIEAMAVGCPVISFARGAASEIVVPQRSGFLVDTMQDMIASVRRLPELDRKSVRSYAKQNFSAQVMAEKYLQVYHRIVAATLTRPTLTALPLAFPAVSLHSDSDKRARALQGTVASPLTLGSDAEILQ